MTTAHLQLYNIFHKDLHLSEERALEETIREKHLSFASKTDIRELELKLETKIEQVRGQIEQSKADTIKWVVGLILAQTALLAGLIKLFA